jgi:hypothetical protein
MKYLVFLFFTLWLFPKYELQAQKLDFYMEDLNFYLDTNYFEVDGYYYFSNGSTTKTEQLIFYPFPNGNGLGSIDSIAVNDNMAQKELPFKVLDKNTGISFLLSIEGLGFRKIRIKYRQTLKEKFASYILNTTEKWGKPLETANYTLFVPDYIRIDSISYEANNMIQGNGKKIYSWNKKDFMPAENFNIFFNY